MNLTIADLFETPNAFDRQKEMDAHSSDDGGTYYVALDDLDNKYHSETHPTVPALTLFKTKFGTDDTLYAYADLDDNGGVHTIKIDSPDWGKVVKYDTFIETLNAVQVSGDLVTTVFVYMWLSAVLDHVSEQHPLPEDDD